MDPIQVRETQRLAFESLVEIADFFVCCRYVIKLRLLSSFGLSEERCLLLDDKRELLQGDQWSG